MKRLQNGFYLHIQSSITQLLNILYLSILLYTFDDNLFLKSDNNQLNVILKCLVHIALFQCLNIGVVTYTTTMQKLLQKKTTTITIDRIRAYQSVHV